MSQRSKYANSCFKLRTPVTVNGHPAEISYSAEKKPMLSCCNRQISIPLSLIAAKLGPVLMGYGVSAVTKFYFERTIPLFQVDFSDEDKLKRFLQARKEVQSATASLLSGMLSDAQKRTNSDCTLQHVDVQTELLLVSFEEAQQIEVNLENYSERVKESEVFNLDSTSGTPDETPLSGELTYKDLLTELHKVVNWFILGIYLDIPESELLKIESDHREKIDACRNAMLLEWMHNADPEPTWSAVVRALVGIRMKDLARKLAHKYGVSLPETEPHEHPFVKERRSWSTVLKLREEEEKIDEELTIIKVSLEKAEGEYSKGKYKLLLAEDRERSAKEEAEIERKEFHQREIELTEKTTRAQELERRRAVLRADLERERIRVDQSLMQSAGAGGHGDVATGTTSVSLISSEVEAYEIYVHDARGNLHTLTIPSSDPENYSIAELRRLFEEQTGQRLDEHQFQFRGQETGHGRQLKHYGIKAHDTLHVVKTGLVVHIINPQVDVCFMVDCTGSMGSWIEAAVKNNVKQLRDQLDADYEGCDVRVAFVRYTDYDQSASTWFGFTKLQPASSQTTWIDFTKSHSAFHDFVGAIRADWNGVDFPEDIMGGLKAVFDSLSWRSSATKVLIHIADAPCHGKQYHDFSDRYPDGDPAGISHVDMMKQVVQNDVQYWFGFIDKANTDKMVLIFNNSVRSLSNNQMMIRQFNAVKPAEIGEAVHRSITTSIFASEAAKRGRSRNS